MYLADVLGQDFATVGTEDEGRITSALRQYGVDLTDPRRRRQLLIDIRTMGRWNSNNGDIVIWLAMHVFGLTATVLGPHMPVLLGPPEQPPTAYMYYTGDHYDAIATAGSVTPFIPEQLFTLPDVDPELLADVRGFVADHDRLTGDDYAQARDAADAHTRTQLDDQHTELTRLLPSLNHHPTHDQLTAILRHYEQLAHLIANQPTLS
jgi:hypothetical protein